MKKIAVLAHNLTVEYASTIAKGISDFFADKENYQIFLIQTSDPDFPYYPYSFQFWANAELMKNLEIDLYIVAASSYCTTLDKNDIANLMRPFSAYKPLVSVGMDLPLGDVKFVDIEVDSVYLEIVNHLKNRHHCRKIGFMAANQTHSKEAKIRQEAFEKAMKACELELNPDWILDGTFMEEYATNEILRKYKTKEEVPFDALVCANDLMAIGSIVAFEKLGLRVPKDIKVFGFDDISHAYTNNPTISTINQHIRQQGLYAAEVAYNILENKEVPIEVKTPAHVHYRQSCGCVRLSEKRNIYKMHRGNLPYYITKKQQYKFSSNSISIDELEQINQLYIRTKLTKNSSDFFEIERLCKRFGFKSLTICTYSKPIQNHAGEVFDLPDTSIVRMHVNTEKNIKNFYEEGIIFNPHQQILPEIVSCSEPGTYLFYPIFHEETQYGYFVCKPKNDYYAVHQVYLDMLSKLSVLYLKRNSSFQMFHKSNQITDVLYEPDTVETAPVNINQVTDELTQILNRQGFLQLGQRQINLATEMKNKGLLIYADIESLKYINDTFGREMGDKTIAIEARVLSSVFRKTDIIGRVGGEEFAIIVQGCDISQMDFFQKKIIAANNQAKKDADFPFELLLTLSAVEFDRSNKNIETLLKDAEKVLSEEKITLL